MLSIEIKGSTMDAHTIIIVPQLKPCYRYNYIIVWILWFNVNLVTECIILLYVQAFNLLPDDH